MISRRLPADNESPARPDPNTYWVAPGKLLAGEYPGDLDDGKAAARLSRWLDAGIRSFVDLTESGWLRPYDTILGNVAAEHGLDVRHMRMTIRDLHVPDPRSMDEILGHIDAEMEAGRPVYVHCHGGVGRTGTA